MYTRFANPHALDSRTEVVSRKTLTADDIESTLEAVNDDVLLTELNRLVKRSLGDLDVSEGADEKARKKRRKLDKEWKDSAQLLEVDGPGLPSSVPFRLVSRTLPPREIDIEFKTVPIIAVREPPCEDNDEEAERRRAQANEAAVNMDWLLKESRRDSVHRMDHERGLLHVKAQLPFTTPSVLIVEKDRPPLKSPKTASVKPNLEVQLSPHTLRSDISVPIIAAAASGQSSQKKSSRNIRRARAKARTAPPRPPTVFWRPLKEWGVSAAGYSVGYEGSWPVYQNVPSRYQYQRDTMRKGVLSIGGRW